MTELVNVTLHDTNYAIQYYPRSSPQDSVPYNPWDKHYYTPLLRPNDTFHYTSNIGNKLAGRENRQISFEFKGKSFETN